MIMTSILISQEKNINIFKHHYDLKTINLWVCANKLYQLLQKFLHTYK